MISLYLGFIFFVQVFFSHPTIQAVRDLPSVTGFLFHLSSPWKIGLILNIMAWIISAIIAGYCIKKYRLVDRIDMQNNGLNWLRLGYILYALVPVLYFSLQTIFRQAENMMNILYLLVMFAMNIAAPAILLIGFIKVMSTLKLSKAA